MDETVTGVHIVWYSIATIHTGIQAHCYNEKMTTWNIAAIFLSRTGAYKLTWSKVSPASAIHQTVQSHQSESIRNYSPSKLIEKIWFLTRVCYNSLQS